MIKFAQNDFVISKNSNQSPISLAPPPPHLTQTKSHIGSIILQTYDMLKYTYMYTFA